MTNDTPYLDSLTETALERCADIYVARNEFLSDDDVLDVLDELLGSAPDDELDALLYDCTRHALSTRLYAVLTADE